MGRFFFIISMIFLPWKSIHAQSPTCELLRNINDNVMIAADENRFVYLNFNEIDLDVIPLLINIMDSNTFSSSSCPIPLSSSSIPNIYIGEIAAKYIECIIDPDFKLKRITKNKKYYSLTIQDMEIIQELYLKWWERNRHYSKKKIGRKKEALHGSTYSWDPCPKWKE